VASGEEEKAEQKRRAIPTGSGQAPDTPTGSGRASGTDAGRSESEKRYPPPPCFCVSRGNKGVTGEFRGCRGNKALSGRRRGKRPGCGAFRNGTTAASTSFVSRMKLRDPQHNRGRIAHYLPFVYYYLVGTSFETGTGRGVENGPTRACCSDSGPRQSSCGLFLFVSLLRA